MKNFFLRRKKIILIIFCTTLNFSCFKKNHGIILAQSILSDRSWFIRHSIPQIKSDVSSKKTPLLPSDLFFIPVSLPEDFNKRFKSDVQKKYLPPLVEKKFFFPYVHEEQDKKTFSDSSFEIFSPLEVSQDQIDYFNSYGEDLIKEKKIELADLEFEGVHMWVSYIQNLLNSNLDAARQKFLEIEKVLNVEERTLLKIQLLYFYNKWSKVEKLANAFLRERTKSDYVSLIFYYLNKSLLAQNKILNQDIFFREIATKNLKPKLRSDFLQILSDEALRQGDIFKAIKFRLDELSNNETSEFSDRKKLLRLLRELRSLDELQILSENHPNLVWLQKQISSVEIEILLKEKRFREALGIVEKELTFYREEGDEEKVKFLNEMQINLTKALNINPRRIGVILPLSSSSTKVSRLAQETLNGLWLALHADKISLQKSESNIIYDVSENENVKTKQQKFSDSWELVIRDSHLSQEITKNVIRDLVEKENVMAVIGPLARKTSEAAAEISQRLRVPLISLSLTDSIPQLGSYIFRNNQSWKKEIIELLDYAVSELRACRFIILYAKTREGRQKMRYFWNETLEKDCEVVAVEGFKDEGQKSLVDEFNTFTGKNLRISMEDQLFLKELKEKEDPIHNFDAVFVAVGSGGVKNLRLIFPYSSVYKMENSIFLGDSGWNDSSLPFAPGLRGVRKTVFVDSFYLSSERPAMKLLRTLHERILYKHQNYIGPKAYTAYAYDTLMILMKLLKDKKNHSHRQLQNALLNMKPYAGVTGNLYFDKNGEVQREMQLLTLRRHKIKPIFQE